jgi:hypothetical protein
VALPNKLWIGMSSSTNPSRSCFWLNHRRASIY